MLDVLPSRSGRLTSEVVPLDALHPTAVEEMWRVFSKYYTDVSREAFDLDLSQKNDVILLLDSGDMSLQGFSTLEEVAYVDIDELSSIDGFDQNTAEELQARARESLEELNAKALERARELGVEQSLFDFEGLTPQMI